MILESVAASVPVRRIARLDLEQAAAQDVHFLPAVPRQVAVAEDAVEEQLPEKVRIDLVEDLLVARKAPDVVLAQGRVLHEGEVVDGGRRAVVPVEIGQDVAHGLHDGHVVRVPGVLVAGADGVEQQAFEGRVAVHGRFLLGFEQLDEVLRGDVAPDLVGLEEEPLEDGAGVADVVRLLHLHDVHVLEQELVQGVEERVRDVQPEAERPEPRQFGQLRRVHFAFFRYGDQDVLVFIDDLLVLRQLVHPVDLDAFLLVGDDVVLFRQFLQRGHPVLGERSSAPL